MNLTEDQKIKKFDELMAEYDKLTSYRSNLAGMLIYGDVVGNDSVVKKLSPEQIKSIYHEISRIDSVTSFISNIIKPEPENENTH